RGLSAKLSTTPAVPGARAGPWAIGLQPVRATTVRWVTGPCSARSTGGTVADTPEIVLDSGISAGFESRPLRCFSGLLSSTSRSGLRCAARRLPKVEQIDGLAERGRRQVHVPERHRERRVSGQLLNRLRRRAPHGEVRAEGVP